MEAVTVKISGASMGIIMHLLRARLLRLKREQHFGGAEYRSGWDGDIDETFAAIEELEAK